MKKLILVAFILIAQSSVGGDWGYWVTESNPKAGRFTIVRIYKLDGTMLHEEHIKGLLDLTKRSVQKRLNKKMLAFSGRAI